MTADSVVEILRQVLMTTLWVSAPILLIGFVAGIVISLVQIVTSIQDSAFSAIPTECVVGSSKTRRPSSSRSHEGRRVGHLRWH